MIQEKDFLYRVPIKTALITTPGGQIRNPEILVDVEGGEFMHGNILDANSTNKLINQSVKDAVDDKFIESGYVTKDLLEAETSARTKGDEDLGAKIKEEQTRAEGKEKEISDKLAIVDGDSNTEGSFRKAIADVIAAHIPTKTSQLTNDSHFITAADVDFTPYATIINLSATESRLDTRIDGKQDKGDYVVYSLKDDGGYYFSRMFTFGADDYSVQIDNRYITISRDPNTAIFGISSLGFTSSAKMVSYGINGITAQGYDDCIPTTNASFKPISDFVLKQSYDEKIAALEARIAALEAKHPEAAA